MHDKTFDVSGAITFWSLQPTSLQAITDLFGRMGFAGCVPNPRTDISALEHSIKEVYGTKNRAPSTRMGNVAGYRAAWINAADYQRKWDEYRAKAAKGEKAEKGEKPAKGEKGEKKK